MSSANFKLKRTAAASRGFLATAGFSCLCYVSKFTEKVQSGGVVVCGIGVLTWSFEVIDHIGNFPISELVSRHSTFLQSAFRISRFRILPIPSRDQLSCFLQGVSTACYAEPCISYGRAVRLSLSVCLSVRLPHAGTESKRRKNHELFTDG